MKPEIVLVRGLPGSGKTAIAKMMEGYVQLEASMYFEVNGKYVYDPAELQKSHQWCLASAKEALEHGKKVVVTNTFARMWEMQRYIDLGYPFRILEAAGSGPNVHGVSKNKVERMKSIWEPLDEVLKLVALSSKPRLRRKLPTIRYKPKYCHHRLKYELFARQKKPGKPGGLHRPTKALEQQAVIRG